MEFRVSLPTLSTLQGFINPLGQSLKNGVDFLCSIVKNIGSYFSSIPEKCRSLFSRVEHLETITHTTTLKTAAIANQLVALETDEEDSIDEIEEEASIDEMDEDTTIGPMRQAMMLTLMLATIASVTQNTPKQSNPDLLYFDGTYWQKIS